MMATFICAIRIKSGSFCADVKQWYPSGIKYPEFQNLNSHVLTLKV